MDRPGGRDPALAWLAGPGAAPPRTPQVKRGPASDFTWRRPECLLQYSITFGLIQPYASRITGRPSPAVAGPPAHAQEDRSWSASSTSCGGAGSPTPPPAAP